MVDMDRELLTSISPALGQEVDPTDRDFQGYLNVVENCMTKVNTSKVNLLDQVYVDNATVGSTPGIDSWITMRQKVEAEVALKVDGQFDKLAETMNTGGVSVGTQPEMLTLRNILRDTPVDSMYLPIRTLKDETTFQPMALNADVAKGFATSLACIDETVSKDLDKNEPTIQGVNKFSQSLVAAGGTNQFPKPNCATPVTCSAGTSADDKACRAGNELMKLKLQLRTLKKYRCDVFVDSRGRRCDPLDMSLNAGGNCLSRDRASGTPILKRKTEYCDLDTFKSYVAKFSTRIENTMNAVDVTVPKVQTKIAADLKTSVKTYITGPILKVVDGVTCNFIGEAFSGMIDGLCLQGVVGFRMIGNSYVACAILTIFTIILAYTVWRRTSDNVHQWSINNPGEPAPQAASV
jgi:hypothetical protein